MHGLGPRRYCEDAHSHLIRGDSRAHEGACKQACMPQQIPVGWLWSLHHGQDTIADTGVPWLQLAGLCKPMSKAGSDATMRCDTDAKRPCTKRVAQRVLAHFANTLIAPQMRSIMPSAGRSHLPTSGHAAQEQCHLPHAIAMASHAAHGVSGQEHKAKCRTAVRRRHQRRNS